MKKLIGSPGTATGLALRIAQIACASTSIGFMGSSFGFSNYSAFCYLIASMVIQIVWSFWLASLDVQALIKKSDLQTRPLIDLLCLGDWATAMLTLAAACSSAGVIVLYARDLNLCKVKSHLPCSSGFEISVGLAIITWILISISSHLTAWIAFSAPV